MDRRTQTKFLLTALAGLATGAFVRLVVRRVKEDREPTARSLYASYGSYKARLTQAGRDSRTDRRGSNLLSSL